MSRSIRPRRTAEQWRSLIAEQAESGLSQQAFCKRKRLSLSTFTLGSAGFLSLGSWRSSPFMD